MSDYYIAAPFGNYVHRDGISSVMGTFTLQQRKGLILALIRTLRYSFSDKAWFKWTKEFLTLLVEKSLRKKGYVSLMSMEIDVSQKKNHENCLKRGKILDQVLKKSNFKHYFIAN